SLCLQDHHVSTTTSWITSPPPTSHLWRTWASKTLPQRILRLERRSCVPWEALAVVDVHESAEGADDSEGSCDELCGYETTGVKENGEHDHVDEEIVGEKADELQDGETEADESRYGEREIVEVN
ncbi:hypothetical protein MTO96_046231, partial [Rhipicephalus appendiculatus]